MKTFGERDYASSRIPREACSISMVRRGCCGRSRAIVAMRLARSFLGSLRIDS